MSSELTETQKKENFLKAQEELKGLFEAVQNGTLEQIKEKVQELINASKGQEEELTLNSIAEGYKEGNGRTILHFAASRGDVEIFRYLASEDNSEVFNEQDKNGNTPLFIAVQHDNLPLVKYIIEEKKADIKMTRTGGTTILHIACSTGNAALVEYLAARGADLEAGSEAGTPLQWAITTQRKDIVKILLSKGANPNSTSAKQEFMPAPLILAIDARDKELFDLLLQHGADFNSKDRDGWSALQFAAEINQVEFCKKLLEGGADPNYECKGQTALDLAFLNGQMEAVALLKPITKKTLGGKVAPEKSQNTVKQDAPINPQEAERLKGEGNKLFAEGKIQEALDKYQEAISHDRNSETSAPIYSNLSLCFLKLGRAQEALDEAKNAKRVNPSQAKGILREAQVYEAMEEYGEAAASYFEVLRLDPTNDDVKHQFDKAMERGKTQYNKRKAGQ